MINPLGLHARAAAKLVRLARQFSSRITLEDRQLRASANAKSILSILGMAAPVGSLVIIRAEGDDEETAIDEVRRLFESGFGEI